MMTTAYDDIFQSCWQQNPMSGHPDGWLRIKAQAVAESALDPRAISSAGARGIMQLMPGTARDLGVASSDMLWDPELNIRAGWRYMTSIYRSLGGVVSPLERWYCALGGYNSGPGHIRQAMHMARNRRYEATDWTCIAVMLPEITGAHARETINYVARVKQIYRDLRIQAP